VVWFSRMYINMNWQEKAAALNALAPIQILMRGIENWYVQQSAEVKEGAMLKGKYGNGTTPELAIEDHWNQLTDLVGREKYIVIGAMSNRRRQVKWNGYMWKDVI